MKKFFSKKTFFLSVLFLLSSSVFADLFHPLNLVKKDGGTLTERINTPANFKRAKTEKQSFADFMRNYPLKESDQEELTVVFDRPTDTQIFENPAAPIIVFYAEYMRKNGLNKKIKFHFTNGEVYKWTDWQKKSELKRDTKTEIAGSLKKWTKYENPIDQEEVFKSYIKTVLANTSVLSIQTYESKPIDFKEIKIGDILWDLGKPGQLCLVVDLCTNKAGEKAVLLAQTNSVTKEFQILKNPKNINDPWYHEQDFLYPIKTPEHVFPKESWRHVNYLD